MLSKETILKSARAKMRLCLACNVCKGEGCAHLSAGPKGRDDNSTFIDNVLDFKKIKIKMDTIHEDYAINTQIKLFNQVYDTPIFCAPIAAVGTHFGTDIDDMTYNDAICMGMQKVNSLAFLGDGNKREYFEASLANLKKYPQNAIITIKPWGNGLDLEKLKQIKELHPLAIAMDVDASGLVHLKNTSTPISFKSVEELRGIKEFIKVPFIIKGITSIEGAQKAMDAHADAIVVSNHGGRVLSDCVSTISVLKEISAFVNKRMIVLFDGGVRSGQDVFKALALGADGVLIGRPLAISAIGEQSAGVEFMMDSYKSALEDAMRMSDCHTISDIDFTKVKIVS